MQRSFVNLKRAQAVLGAALLLFLAAGCTGCNISGEQNKAVQKKDSIAIMTWNVQNLFDGVDDGTEYDEYREAAGWTREKYRGRLNVIAGAIGAMARKPDIIALQEVESLLVMTDLAAALSAQGYGWTHFAKIPGMALGIGLLSRFPLGEARSHSVYIDGDIAPRPMLEVRIETQVQDNAPLALFVCHWKSKLGDVNVTEGTRRASARIIVRRLREIAEKEPDLPVVIMGDLNENHDEFYRLSGTAISALLPDDPRAADTAEMTGGPQKDFIIISRNKPPVARYFPAGAVTLYSPWTAELEDGSYNYKNEWETIDHFLLSPQLFTGAGWDFENCQVVNHQPFAGAKGLPVSFNPRTGSGLSDHFPLLLLLKMRE